jgi:Fe-S cluster assembly protein SufD
MAQLLQQLADVRPQNPDWLHSLNEAGAAVVRNAIWPTRKTEQWKYTSLRALEQADYFAARGRAPESLAGLAGRCTIDQLDAHTIVFVNGVYSAALSKLQALEKDVDLLSFGDANAQQSIAIRQWLGSVVESEQHLFAAINNQLLDSGVFLRVGKNVQLTKPVQVVWLTTGGETSFHVPQRLLVVMEPNASATVVEQFISTDEPQTCFTHGVTEVRLEDGARCAHYRLHLEAPGALHAGGVYAALGANSHFNSFHLGLGGVLKRIDVVINHNGSGANCVLNGVYLPRENQQIDYHTCIEHRVPHCTTQEVFRGIVADSAKAVFNGRIHIHPNAQKTLAQLSNKNLLLSDKAEVDTKPELEIYADDVQCAHGATVARLDANALHYFRTRGVSQREAEVMLSFGFINELIDKLSLPALTDYLRPVLTEWFAQDPSLVRHLLDMSGQEPYGE